MKVPWISKHQIANKADRTLRKYESKISRFIAPPIQVEDIIERHLDLQIGFMDFETTYGMEDVLGATFVQSRMICVSDKLARKRLEGRICFTYAHEVGHWVLHRKFVPKYQDDDSTGRPILCRTRDAKLPVEWQADYFAACLLMPERFVKDAWDCTYGPEPLVLYNHESCLNGPIVVDPCVANWPFIANEVLRAGNFRNVSKQAMMIRLQDLGLVRNQSRVPMGWRHDNQHTSELV